MPWKPKSICRYPGCNEFCHDTYCDKHKKQIAKERNSTNSKIYNSRWRRVSKTYLKEYPLCVQCRKEGRLTPATEVDHIIPHKGDMKLFWNKNDSNMINPIAYLSIEEIEVEGKKILHSYVPESSQVHKCSGKIYDRNEDGDFDISENTTLVSNMYIRKQGTYIENKIFPFAKMTDLKKDLFSRVRQMAMNQRSNHPCRYSSIWNRRINSSSTFVF